MTPEEDNVLSAADFGSWALWWYAEGIAIAWAARCPFDTIIFLKNGEEIARDSFHQENGGSK